MSAVLNCRAGASPAANWIGNQKRSPDNIGLASVTAYEQGEMEKGLRSKIKLRVAHAIGSIGVRMKMKLYLTVLVTVISFALLGRGQETKERPAGEAAATAATPIFTKLSEAKWDKILPDLGENSPEICILRVDPKTQATSLLIRTSKAIHVRKHWHTANETHTMIIGTAKLACDGKTAEIGPGGFNYMPAKMVHEGWLPAGSLTFITVDGAWDINWVEGPPTSADLSRTY